MRREIRDIRSDDKIDDPVGNDDLFARLLAAERADHGRELQGRSKISTRTARSPQMR